MSDATQASTPASAPAWDGVLVRFGEIGIKSAPVRRHMMERLRENLLTNMLARGIEGDVTMMGARLWMQGANADALADVAVHTFGVVTASPCRKVPATMEALCTAASGIALTQPWTRFAIRAQREGKHPFSSQEVAIKTGSAVFVAAEAAGRKPKVDLETPECELHIDVRGGDAYVFLHHLEGPGGIPAGSQGKIAVLAENADDVVAAWLLARRGCHVKLHGKLPATLLATLQRWGFAPPLDTPAGATRAERMQALWERVQNRDVLAIADGTGLAGISRVAGVPTLRPLAGLDPATTASVRRRVLGAA